VVAADGWPDGLSELPAVGPYTAAAVGSFAGERRERVLAGLERDGFVARASDGAPRLP